MPEFWEFSLVNLKILKSKANKMFTHPFQKAYNKEFNDTETKYEKYAISDHGYGKDAVKVLHIKRDGAVHSIRELEVSTYLKLYSKKDYIKGDNSDIIATDSQKNTVYLLAKKHGVENPEKFALLLANHFLTKYAHVEEVHIKVHEYPWQRMQQDDIKCPDEPVNVQHEKNFSEVQNRMQHNHAFIFTPTALRYCDVYLRRHGGY